MKRILSLLMCLLLILSVPAVSFAELKPWTTMKDFRVKTLDGSTFELYKTLEEKDLVLIDLWYIDCEPCARASASLNLVQEKYGDRVGFISINPFDGEKAIRSYLSAKGFTLPAARYPAGKKWVLDGCPHFIIVDKDATILYSDMGATYPGDVEELLDKCLSMTPEQKAEYSADHRILSFSSLTPDETPAEKRRLAYVFSAKYSYNLNDNMSMTIEGKGIRRIVVDDNLHVLELLEHAGEFFILAPGRSYTVTVKTGKGFRASKACLYTLEVASTGLPGAIKNFTPIDEIPFRKARKTKDGYVFELKLQSNDTAGYIAESGDMMDDDNKYSRLGFHIFANTARAKRYFEKCTERYGYEFGWHIEE